MVKPFTGAHLDARITTVLRRAGRASRTVQPAVHSVGGLRVDVGERSALLDGEPLALTRKEFDLLAYLAARPGPGSVPPGTLGGGMAAAIGRRGPDHRRSPVLAPPKMGESAAKPRYLRTVRGVGFRLVAPD